MDELREKVAGLTEPSREVDGAIALDIDRWRCKTEPDGFTYWRGGPHNASWTREDSNTYPPNYTASLDTALALVERAAPMMWLSIEWAGSSKPPREWPVVEFGFGEHGHKVQAKTAPLAILLALFTASDKEDAVD